MKHSELESLIETIVKRVLTESKDIKLSLYDEDYTLFIKKEKYRNNNSMSVSLIDKEDGSPFATISVNLPESDNLSKDEFFVKDWSENKDIVQQLIKQKVIIPTGKSARSGYVNPKSYKLGSGY